LFFVLVVTDNICSLKFRIGGFVRNVSVRYFFLFSFESTAYLQGRAVC